MKAETSNMNYTPEQVARGRKLVTADAMNRLAIGDLILEVAPMGSHGGDKKSEAAKREAIKTTAVVLKFSAEIGLDESQASSFREVAAKIPLELRGLATKNNVTITWGVWKFAAFGTGRLEKLTQLIGKRKNGRIKVDEFQQMFTNQSGEPFAPQHRTSQSLPGQLADPVARQSLINAVGNDPEAAEAVASIALDKKLESKFGKPPANPPKDKRKDKLFSQPLALMNLTSAAEEVVKVYKELQNLNQPIDETSRTIYITALDNLDTASAGIRVIISAIVGDSVPSDW